MKQEIKPATGRLGVLVVGVGGAVATTMIVGTLASRKGLAKPIGSITQLATMRMENNEEKLIDRKSTRLNSSHRLESRMPSSA